MPASGAIINRELARRRETKEQDVHKNIIWVAEKETSKNVFQRLMGHSEPKGLSEVFRNHEASEEVEDKKAKLPRWVDVKPSPAKLPWQCKTRMEGEDNEPSFPQLLRKIQPDSTQNGI